MPTRLVFQKKDTLKVVDATLETIQAVLEKGDTISFIGFGTFSTADRAARKARVPGTKKVIDVPASKAVKFKVGKNLKKQLLLALLKKVKRNNFLFRGAMSSLFLSSHKNKIQS